MAESSVIFTLWIFIIVLLGILFAILVLGLFFVFRRRTIFKVIMPDKTIKSKQKFGNVEKTENIGDGIYFVDDECIIRGFWGFQIWYFYGNPNPIKFDFLKNMPQQIGTKAQDLGSFHDSNLIQKLFATESLENIIMWLVIGCILIGVVNLIFGIVPSGNPPVQLSPDGNNTQIIVNAVRIALRGQ